MIVVSDTTPLISLIKINKLSILEKLFGKVFIPIKVFEELTTNYSFKDEAELIKNSIFIEVISVKNIDSVEIFRRATGLDRGESEAIVLTDEMNADLLLMDERHGRHIAKKMGLAVVGTLGVLYSAYEEEILTKEDVINCLDELKKSNIRISDSLHNDLMDKIKCSK